MPKYEYRVVQSSAGAAIGHLNDRINQMAEEGWEVVHIIERGKVWIPQRREGKQTSLSI